MRIVAAQAIKDGAFDPPYHSWEDLEKPRDAEYAELHWKKEMLDREIFALSHETERALWYRTLLVAGYREPMRLYSIRVGAGARLDSMCSAPIAMPIKANLGFRVVYFGAAQLCALQFQQSIRGVLPAEEFQWRPCSSRIRRACTRQRRTVQTYAGGLF